MLNEKKERSRISGAKKKGRHKEALRNYPLEEKTARAAFVPAKKRGGECGRLKPSGKGMILHWPAEVGGEEKGPIPRMARTRTAW